MSLGTLKGTILLLLLLLLLFGLKKQKTNISDIYGVTNITHVIYVQPFIYAKYIKQINDSESHQDVHYGLWRESLINKGPNQLLGLPRSFVLLH